LSRHNLDALGRHFATQAINEANDWRNTDSDTQGGINA